MSTDMYTKIMLTLIALALGQIAWNIDQMVVDCAYYAVVGKKETGQTIQPSKQGKCLLVENGVFDKLPTVHEWSYFEPQKER